MIELIRYAGKVYIGLENLEEDPNAKEISEKDLLEQVDEAYEDNWKSLYLRPIAVAIRQMFDLEPGSVTVYNYKKISPFGNDNYGFAIMGNVKFKDFMPSDLGVPPFRFFAEIEPNGELLLPIKVVGS